MKHRNFNAPASPTVSSGSGSNDPFSDISNDYVYFDAADATTLTIDGSSDRVLSWVGKNDPTVGWVGTNDSTPYGIKYNDTNKSLDLSQGLLDQNQANEALRNWLGAHDDVTIYILMKEDSYANQSAIISGFYEGGANDSYLWLYTENNSIRLSQRRDWSVGTGSDHNMRAASRPTYQYTDFSYGNWYLHSWACTRNAIGYGRTDGILTTSANTSADVAFPTYDYIQLGRRINVINSKSAAACEIRGILFCSGELVSDSSDYNAIKTKFEELNSDITISTLTV